MGVEVSVVMAAHDEQPQILRAAIDSILGQTQKNVELIICDDGSGLQTSSYLNERAKRREFLLIRNETALGAGAARNRALKMARGQYIAIMDADDISESTRLEKELDFLKADDTLAFVGCRGEFFNRIPGDMREYYWFIKKPMPSDFLMTLPFVHASLLFRKCALDSANGYRETRKVRRSEDYDLLMRLYEQGFNGANLPETLYYIRVNEETIRRRKYRYRINEVMVKAEGFARLGLMPKGIAYAVKPLIVGLIPNAILKKLKKYYYSK